MSDYSFRRPASLYLRPGGLAGRNGWLALLLIICGSLAACAPDAPDALAEQPEQVRAENAVMRAPIAGRNVSSAYLKIINPGNTALLLESVHSDQAGAIEIHEHRDVDGQMRMRRVPSVEVPANDQLELKPGGLHLMLFRLSLSGEPLILELRFSDGSIIQTIAAIEEI